MLEESRLPRLESEKMALLELPGDGPRACNSMRISLTSSGQGKSGTIRNYQSGRWSGKGRERQEYSGIGRVDAAPVGWLGGWLKYGKEGIQHWKNGRRIPAEMPSP